MCIKCKIWHQFSTFLAYSIFNDPIIIFWEHIKAINIWTIQVFFFFVYISIFCYTHHKISMKSAWTLVYVKSIELFTCFSEFCFCLGSLWDLSLNIDHTHASKTKETVFYALAVWLCVCGFEKPIIPVWPHIHTYWIIRDNVSMSLLFEKKGKKCLVGSNENAHIYSKWEWGLEFIVHRMSYIKMLTKRK